MLMNKRVFDIYDLRRHNDHMDVISFSAFSAMKEVFHHTKFQAVTSSERYDILVIDEVTEEKYYFQIIQ